jgi:hypothetical protein
LIATASPFGIVLVLSVSALTLAAQETRDAEIESFLSRARVVSNEPIGAGITGARKLRLELDGEVRAAAFKTVDIQRTRLTRFKHSPTELNFTDNYRYERAAYLLDRALGVNMTPVTVIRTIDGREGAVIQWIDDAINEAERIEQAIPIADQGALNRQRNTMTMFDALVANVDRHRGNQLITPHDGRLHLIDFSRSFRPTRKLRPGFLSTPASISQGMLDKMEDLTLAEVARMMQGVLSSVQVKGILHRRDRLLKKISRDREQYGDDLVIFRSKEIHP